MNYILLLFSLKDALLDDYVIHSCLLEFGSQFLIHFIYLWNYVYLCFIWVYLLT